MVLAIGSKLADIDTNLLPLTNIYLHIISQCRLLMFSRSRECKTGYGAAGECGAQIRTRDSKTKVSKSSRREQTSSPSQRQYCESPSLLPLLPPSSTSPFLFLFITVLNCSSIHLLRMQLTVLGGNPLSLLERYPHFKGFLREVQLSIYMYQISLCPSSPASPGGAGGGIHLQHPLEEDTFSQEGERGSGNELWTRGGVSYQRSLQKVGSGDEIIVCSLCVGITVELL